MEDITRFIATFARPGGNITGLSTLAPEISGKQLELLKEVVPNLTRVVVLGTSNTPGNAQSLKETETPEACWACRLNT
jgi:putative ABC transport system substrate-binding protein